ncbi:formate dehydrogenase accessory sulfurtransferase FdhD [Shewanella eurypsychrophilus]|uniref:Sulfur carrier protein FdhD n=1 Tax=Shewanella eurypsychrophilus TaxID=2593656 RepID=A0ABX6VDV9_9GAMM|nr:MULTISPECIES: formate dehydrogenase accessory sulfurtransferase FdhD [Shewanella]QFU24528.1 formate dehydrogenase accessory sulfurtransferase FdhD [Shewanella sp. YLB-09]QPG59726.1 formate dehydrogenase accessory sulfurtransferase FdhD [Shewanella eurypsychrophilus]
MSSIKTQIHNVIEHKKVRCFRNFRESEIVESVASEVRVALIYNGISHTVMMASPADLEYFAIGFTLSERIVEKPADIKSIELEPNDKGVLIYIEITNRCFMALKDQRRNMAGRTGCGLCGVAQLEHAVKPTIRVNNNKRFNINLLQNVLSQLPKVQTMFNITGATHAAMSLSESGEITSSYEDIGRHIALDKLIGSYSKNGQITPAAILLTSRASFEMVQKSASANIEIIFAISAATSLAIELADKSNITLVGFCRNNRATIYTHSHRITSENLNKLTAIELEKKMAY